MHQVIHRRVAYCCLFVAIIFTLIALQNQPTSGKSSVVLSNMPGSNNHAESIMDGQDVVVLFDVPTGKDYQVNSIQTSLTNDNSETQTVTARIHADDNGTPGDVVVDLGSQLMPAGSYVPTFTPTESSLLPSGGRYWLVLSNAGDNVQWRAADRTTSKSSVFSIVENGIMNDDTFTAQTAYHFCLTIDADPMEK
jgi:hypothetical protein